MTATLSEVCALTMGQAPPGDTYNDRSEGVPLIAGAGDFRGQSISATKFTTQPGKICAAGDIVLSIRASIGAKVWADREYCLGRGVAGLRPNSMLDAKYLWHWLSHSEANLVAKGRGATFLQVNRNDIGEMPIDLPSIQEQRRIAAILDHADALRAKRRTSLDDLQGFLEASFLDLFGNPSTWSETWRMGTIGDITRSARYGTSEKAASTGSIPVLRMGNLTVNGRLDTSSLKYMSLSERDCDRYTVRRGDVLFNRTNSADLVGKTAVVHTDEQFAFAGYLVRLRLTEGNEPDYVSGYLNSRHGKVTLRSMCKSIVGQANINAKELQTIPIALPPSEIQRRYADLVIKVEGRRTSMLTQSAELDALFASLQFRAFRGEL